jgi:LCP family protein required for cell wall assembly
MASETRPSTPSTRILLAAALAIVVIGAGVYWWFSRSTDEPVDQTATSTQLHKTEPLGSNGAQGIAPSAQTGSVSSGGAATGAQELAPSAQTPRAGSSSDSEVTGTAPLIAVFGVERLGETSRPDAVVVVGIDTRTDSPVVVSLRPDEPIEQLGTIASVYADFGPSSVTRLIGELLSIPLTQYMVLDYEEFESVIDKLGGVELEVQESFGVRRADGSLISIKPGTPNLNGEQALAYIRYKWAGDERARLMRQARFLQALGSRLAQRSTVALLPSLVRDAFALIETNITLPAAVAMVEQLRWSDMNNYRLVVIAGARWEEGNVSAFRTPAEFAESGIGFGGIEQAR